MRPTAGGIRALVNWPPAGLVQYDNWDFEMSDNPLENRIAAVPDTVPLETLQAGLADGMTLLQILESNGADVADVQAALIEALADLPAVADQDVAATVDALLNGELGGLQP